MLRSVNNIVIAPARTESESKRRITVNNTAHTKSGIRSNWIPINRILIIVVIKLIAPKIDDAPARCNDKIVKFTEEPLWAIFPAEGG